MNRQDMRMVKCSGCTRLDLKTPQKFFILLLLNWQDFDCHKALQPRVFCQPDITHAASPDTSYKTISAQTLSVDCLLEWKNALLVHQTLSFILLNDKAKSGEREIVFSMIRESISPYFRV